MGVLTDGATNYLSFPDTEPALDWERTQAFSGACWAFMPNDAAGPIFSKASSQTGTGVGWAFNLPNLEIHLTHDNAANNQIRCFGQAPGNLPAGGTMYCTWQHVGWSYDGSSTVAGCKLYVNGVSVTTGGAFPNVDNLSASILVSEPVRSGWIPPSEYVNAAVADFVLVDAVMTAADFAALAKLENIGVPRSRLLSVAPVLWVPAYSPSDIADYSGNAYNGTATNSPAAFGGPTVALDAFSSATITTTASFTHTPRGTPRGVVVTIVQNASAADRITSVTYGGVAMTRVTSAADAAGETGAVYEYFLGSGIPAGSQSVEVTVSTGTETKYVMCSSWLGRGDMRVVTSNTTSGDQANPAVTLATPATFEGMVVATLFSGVSATGSITIPSAWAGFPSSDFGAQVTKGLYGQASGASVAPGFTVVSDDVAMTAVAFEVIPEAPQLVLAR